MLGIILFIFFSLSIFISGILNFNLYDDTGSYETPRLVTLNPKIHTITSEKDRYVYVSTDKSIKFSYPKDWKVENCLADCEFSSLYTFTSPTGESPISVTVIKPANWCDSEIDRMGGMRGWKDVHIIGDYQTYAETNLIEGIQEDSSGKGDIYQQSTKYVQSEDACYIIMNHTKNNQELFREAQIIRDSFYILK